MITTPNKATKNQNQMYFNLFQRYIFPKVNIGDRKVTNIEKSPINKHTYVYINRPICGCSIAKIDSSPPILEFIIQSPRFSCGDGSQTAGAVIDMRKHRPHAHTANHMAYLT